MSMFNGFKLVVLEILKRKQCPDSIPRSGTDAKKVDCYSVRFDSKSLKPHTLITNVKNKEITIKLWNGNSFDNNHKCKMSDLHGLVVRVVHYKGLYTIEYTGWTSLILRGIFGYDRLKILFFDSIKTISQYYFNRTNNLSIQNIELMNTLLDLHFNNKEINIYNISDSIYTSKWFYHPNKDQYRKKIDLHLNSLIEVGAINKDGINYSVNGKLINLVTDSEKENDRHNDNIASQRRMFQVTSVLVAITAVSIFIQL